MKTIKFYRRPPQKSYLPQWLEDELRVSIQSVENSGCGMKVPTVSDTLIEAIEATGIDREELCERMKKPGGKTEITPHYLDLMLAQESPEMWLQMRILKALQIKWEDYSRIIDANNKMRQKVYDRYDAHIKALQNYSEYGPHLFGLIKAEQNYSIYHSSKSPAFKRLMMKPNKDHFDPPSAEAIGDAIANHPDICAERQENQRLGIAAYRYHRLPNEVYDIDLQGNLIASGDANMDPPPGLMVVKISGRCGCCYMPMRKVVPPALLQQAKLKLSGKPPNKSRKPRR